MHMYAVHVHNTSYAVVMDWLTKTQEYYMRITGEDGECLYSSLEESPELNGLDTYLAILKNLGIYLPDKWLMAWLNMRR